MKNIGTLLIEIGTEELPIYNLKNIGKDFIKYVSEYLNLNNFKFSKIKYFISLRRISCLVFKLNYNQKLTIKYNKIYGPSILLDKINYNIKIINIWCKNNNLKKKDIFFIDKDNKRFFYYKKYIKSKNISYFIKKFLFIILSRLKKNRIFMKWGINNFSFIRPVNNICILFNDKIINLCLFGIKSSNFIRSHKFLNNNIFIKLDNSNNYLNILKEKCNVIVDYNKRKKIIIKNINILFSKLNILFRNYNNNYINRIVSLVEWPLVKIAKFNKNYLFLPKDLIILILENQNCFYILDNLGNLINKFIIVLDINKKYYKNILFNYIRIIESKLNDAFFLLLKDIKFPLISNLNKLNNLIFHKYLGNYLNKVKRIFYISKYLFNILNLKINLNLLNISIILCKCDLVTNLYKEFNMLKGYIGMYYYNLDNNNNDISLIIKEHYYPICFNNYISNNIYSNLISLCDKFDTLIGISLLKNCFFLKKSNDPYGLRRLCLSIIKIVIYKNLYFNFKYLIKYIIKLFNFNLNNSNYLVDYIVKFILKRCLIYFINLNYEKKLIISLINIKIYNILEIKNRMDFIINFKNKKLKDFNYILNINKRLKNIIKNNIKFKKVKLNKYFMIKNDFNFLNDYKYFKVNSYKFIYNKKYKLLFNLYYNFCFKIDNYLNNNRIFVLDNINLTKFRLSLLNNIFLIFLDFIDFNNLL